MFAGLANRLIFLTDDVPCHPVKVIVDDDGGDAFSHSLSIWCSRMSLSLPSALCYHSALSTCFITEENSPKEVKYFPKLCTQFKLMSGRTQSPGSFYRASVSQRDVRQPKSEVTFNHQSNNPVVLVVS